ncbi:Hsc70-interacting protein [Frankliniella fusca]|uniref:Hsc70-interacting protein n=1 Tax=Frankliniella fusca TaxID=407009 RepID=A0AAE1HJ81_9NEOP|nr:Hsc70-interacting protein [Frankliniella fusca]
MAAFGSEQLKQLKAFIELCKNKPSILHRDEFKFFKDYIESLGGKIPSSVSGDDAGPKPTTFTPKSENKSEPEPEPEVESEESDVELDNEGVIEPDALDDVAIPDPEKEVSEENEEKSREKASEANQALQSGELENAIKLYTEAISLNPGKAILFAKRGQAYLKLQKPNACIRDCSQALKLNPDSAQAYKFKGRAHRLLGQWEEAAKDLRSAAKIDLDEQTDEWLREVTPNVSTLQHQEQKPYFKNSG